MKSNEIKPLVWNNERVLTTKQIAEAYGCKEKQIRQNFNNHKDRYKEGKHYYTLKGSDLKFFKDYVNSMEYVDNIDLVDKRAPHTTIYTKKGAFMAAKLIDTDKAWDMYEQLVDHYFTVNDAVNKPALPSDPNEILKLIVQANENVSKRVTAIEQDNIVMKEQMSTINDVIILSAEHWEEVKKVVMERVHGITGNVSKQRKLYRGLWKAMQEQYNVTKCKQIKDKDYADAIEFINNWEGVS